MALLAVLGIAWAVEPPTVRLAAGVHQGPLVLDHAQTVVGEAGAIVRGGILVTADDVTVRDLTVRGGEYGIEVRDAESVEIDDVVIESAELDGINARQSEVAISDCEIRSLPGTASQGIDISFASQLPASVVEDCVIVGGSEGIVSHMANVMVRDNRVQSTELRGIAVTEMSMGDVEDNLVEDALGIGIFCGDYSHCSIEDNRVTGHAHGSVGQPDTGGARARRPLLGHRDGRGQHARSPTGILHRCPYRASLTSGAPASRRSGPASRRAAATSPARRSRATATPGSATGPSSRTR